MVCYVEKNSGATSGLVCKGQHPLVMSAVGTGLECGGTDARPLASDPGLNYKVVVAL